MQRRRKLHTPQRLSNFVKTTKTHKTIKQTNKLTLMSFSFNLRFPSQSPRISSLTCQLHQHPSHLSLPEPPLSKTTKIPCSSAPRRTCVAVRFHFAMENNLPSENQMHVHVLPHPLIKHWISVLRNSETPCPIFKNAMGELGRILLYEASRDWLPTVAGEIQSPMGVASVEFIDPKKPVAVIPILRAGLALAEHASSVLPASKTYHIGISRNEETLQPTVYLNKLPQKFAEGSKVFVVDPMLATGGTIVATLKILNERGVGNKQIRVISAVSAPPALQKLREQFPGLQVYTGVIDPKVNEIGFIIPGLGDAGDRSFGT